MQNLNGLAIRNGAQIFARAWTDGGIITIENVQNVVKIYMNELPTN